MTTIDDLRQTFFEESAEGLAAINTGLGGLTEASPGETANTIFRAIHSIKGGAGIFGFAGLVEFAHVFETVLDQVRHGKIAPSPQVVAVLRQAEQTLAALVTMAQSREQAPAQFDADSRAALTQLVNGGASANDATKSDAAEFDDIDFEPIRANDDGAATQARRFNLAYRSPQARYDDNFTVVLKVLRAVGRVQLQLDLDAIPTLEQCDPRRAYIVCNGTIDSDLAAPQLHDILSAIDPSEAWRLGDEITAPRDQYAQ